MERHLVALFLIAALSQSVLGFDESQLGQKPEAEIPDYFRLCVRNSDGLDQCLKDSVQQILSKLGNGIPAFGLEPLDPYVRDTFKAAVDRDGINVIMSGKNIKMYGVSNGRVENVKSEISDNTLSMEVDVYFPKLYTEGSFKAQGQFSGLNIDSRGPFNVSMTEVKTTWKISGVTEERNGEQYLRVKEFTMDPDVGDMEVFMDGVFPDNEALNRIANYLMNQFWRVVYRELKPFAMRAWDAVMIDMANTVFLNVPFSRLLPIAQ